MRSNAWVGVSRKGIEASAQVVTGPQEDVYLSANLPFDTLDTSFRRIPLSQQPGGFYLSLDYLPFGDLYLQDLQPVVHLCAKVSESPFDTVGGGIGVRLPNLWGVMDLSNVTLSLSLLRMQGGGSEEWAWSCQVGYNLISFFRDGFK
jgi:hypothetical protein